MRHLDFYRSSLPAHSLWNMLSDVDGFFDRTLDADEKNIAFSPRTNIEETKDAYLLNLDLPGVKREDVKIDINARTLTVSGDRKSETQTERAGFQRYECVTGAFSRSFTVPDGIDANQVDATLADGVLRVTIRKAEAEKPRSIEIK